MKSSFSWPTGLVQMEPMEEDDSVPTNHIVLTQMSLTPKFKPIHEVVPRLSFYERVRLDTLTSLNFMEFQGQMVMCHRERGILFKGFRILEKRIERLMAGDRTDQDVKLESFLVFLKIGHITLLAGDFARSLSAYQQALGLCEEHFWKDSGAYFGLGIVYLHFKAYGCAIDAFNRCLYTNPTSIIASEVNARLAVCYKGLNSFKDAIRHFQSAIHDRVQPHFLTIDQLKLNIALTHDSAGNIEESYNYCTKLLNSGPHHHLMKAAIERELGWLCYRAVNDPDSTLTIDEKRSKLMEAEQHLQESKLLHPESGKTHYYLGRCYGEQTPAKAHDAFLNYRASIDKQEADSDTWCSIGMLYHQQNQPMDALQAFVCAVDLDHEHSAAWTNLGQLYESHFRYPDALSCYKNALKYNPLDSELIKARVTVMETQLAQSPALSTHQARPGPYLQQGSRLPALKEAGMQPIPSELRQRQEDNIKNKQQRYRDGSILWRMAELGTTTTGPNLHPEPRCLDPSQLNMMRILQHAEGPLDETCTEVLRSLQARFNQFGCAEGTEMPLCLHTVEMTPSQVTDADINNFTSLFDIDEGGNQVIVPKDEPESEDDDDKDTITKQEYAVSIRTELPMSFSLLAPLHESLDITSSEVMSRSHDRSERPDKFKPLFEERVGPPTQPVPPPNKPGENLYRQTPIVVVESRKDAHNIELQRFCENAPIALIRGMTIGLKMDLSVFSTKTLVENFPDTELEIRTQTKFHADLNLNSVGEPTWACESTQNYSTIGKYGLYQIESFKASLKDETDKVRNQKYGSAAEAAKRRKMNSVEENSTAALKQIKFGTNIDFSDDKKFKPQLNELAKMPPFCRIIAGCNLLSHLGHIVYGMNTAQGYMKVPGNRTPAHMENNCLASVNINVGPGDCEWFGVPHEYWGVIDAQCRKRKIDFLNGSWWPNADELVSMGIPIYRFTQKAGDMVWVGPGCVHWVQATGWCNNVAWNVAPITHLQLTMAVHQYEWNKLQKYKSLVPMQHLFWQIAKNVQVTNMKVFKMVRGMLIRSLSYCKMVVDWYTKNTGKTIKIQLRETGGVSNYCTACQVETWNILFTKENGKFYEVYCVDCARKSTLTDYYVIQEIPFPDLLHIFDNFQHHVISKTALVV